MTSSPTDPNALGVTAPQTDAVAEPSPVTEEVANDDDTGEVADVGAAGHFDLE